MGGQQPLTACEREIERVWAGEKDRGLEGGTGGWRDAESHWMEGEGGGGGGEHLTVPRETLSSSHRTRP